MSKNGMATYDKALNYVNLTHLPTPKKEYTINFEKLTGGLNIYDPDYRLKLNESPDMENMLWKNGTLCSRFGQEYVYRPSSSIGDGHTCFHELFFDNAFFHIGSQILYGEPDPDEMTLTTLCDLETIYGTGKGKTRGVFLRYQDDLIYKARGVFLRIYRSGSSFAYENVAAAANAYTPITYVNASWANGSGDSYQPENRISPKKTIWYNAGTEEKVQTFSGNGSTTDFTITLTGFVYITDVSVDGMSVGNWDVSGTTLHFYTSPNTWSVENGDMHLISAPPSGTDNVVVTCQCAVTTYYLPVKDTAVSPTLTIDKIEVFENGTWVTKQANTDYTFSAATGLVTFSTAPEVTQPLSSNTVRITYSWPNTDAMDSIMDCPYAIVYGGNQNICMVVGGCTKQPNAFFWNGNNVAMDIHYWPMEQYNLGGETEDAITGFGRQQGHLVVFKNKSVGKVSMQFTTVDTDSDTTARTYIEMDYTSINSMIGCDLPWSIQLIDNNLVFCNSDQGVHYIKDSSSAYENNIVGISTKVNGDAGRHGLLSLVQGATRVSSFDDTKRYWLIADDKVYCWDYTLSDYKDPSWFYLSGVAAEAVFMDVETIYHLNKAGCVSVFNNSYGDYGEGYERRYQFATQYMGTYDRLKTVTNAIYTFRADTDFNIRLTYLNDYETRDDLTPIVSRTWRLVPRNLEWRDMTVEPFAHVARRRPGCRHVRHFSSVLRCTDKGYDMPILSAQVMYKYEGRDR